jgi:SulP family sulfate permease
MILFPLGTPIFSHLGSAGISIYYVSTIVAQLVFSTGSIFRGAVGSELVCAGYDDKYPNILI